MREMPHSLADTDLGIEDPRDFLNDIGEMIEYEKEGGEKFEIEAGLYDEIKDIVDKFSDIYDKADFAYRLF